MLWSCSSFCESIHRQLSDIEFAFFSCLSQHYINPSFPSFKYNYRSKIITRLADIDKRP